MMKQINVMLKQKNWKKNDLQKKTSRHEPLYFKGKGIFEKQEKI
jgi:hypothetical protein